MIEKAIKMMEDLVQDFNTYKKSPHDCGGKKDVVTYVADWNEDGMDEIKDILDKISDTVETNFDDEIVICESCGCACELYPSFYGAHVSWIDLGSEIHCRDCFMEEDIPCLFINNPKAALPAWAFEKALKEGFIQSDKIFESGLFKHQDDNPDKIFEAEKKFHDEIVFIIKETSQFYSTFTFLYRY